MNASANLDIRYPIGGLFLALGALLVVYGLFVQSATMSLSSNIDLWWGVIMLVFSALLLALARAAARRMANTKPPTEDS
ncbi:MAG TPA: hypothetical protein VII66_07535 [Gemmatimonadaceae bacterium]